MTQQEDLIEKFKKQYELFTNSIASSKKSFTSTQTIQNVRKTLDLLQKILNTGQIDKLEFYMVYNTLILSKTYSNLVLIPSVSPKKWHLLAIKESLEKFREQGIFEQIEQKRK